MYEPWGYKEDNEIYTLRNAIDDAIETGKRTDQQQDADIDKIFDEAFFHTVYDEDREAIIFSNSEGEEVASVSMSDIVVSSLIESAYYDKSTKQIVIIFENGDEVRIDCEDLIDIVEFGDGLKEVSGTVSINLDSSSESIVIDDSGNTAQVLTVGEDGIKISNIQEAINVETRRAHSAETALQHALEEEIDRAKRAESSMTSGSSALVERVDELEEKLDALIEKIDTAFRIDGQDVQIYLEEAWTSINDALRQVVNETY